MRAKHWTSFLKGRPRQAGSMNATEQAYAADLDQRLHAGEVLWYAFEPWKFRLAKGAYYTPDFAVMLADGTCELIDVKGFWAEAARVRMKVAAETYWMFRWVAVTKQAKKRGGGWKREEFGNTITEE